MLPQPAIYTVSKSEIYEASTLQTRVHTYMDRESISAYDLSLKLKMREDDVKLLLGRPWDLLTAWRIAHVLGLEPAVRLCIPPS